MSALEESLAALLPPDDLEGEIARLGAVTAALCAGDPVRALQLADRFLGEALAPEVAEQLRGFLQEATAARARAAAGAPAIPSAPLTLRRA